MALNTVDRHSNTIGPPLAIVFGLQSTGVGQPIKIELQRASILIFFSAKRRKKNLLSPKMGRRPIAESVVFLKTAMGDMAIMALKV